MKDRGAVSETSKSPLGVNGRDDGTVELGRLNLRVMNTEQRE
jgi:hypothetical protein